jgi:hypothetical protein
VSAQVVRVFVRYQFGRWSIAREQWGTLTMLVQSRETLEEAIKDASNLIGFHIPLEFQVAELS